METKNGIRQRRQERIRRIMDNSQLAPGLQHIREPESAVDFIQQALPTEPLIRESNDRNREREGGLGAREQDPERLWKAQSNPWESAGWRLAPASSKESRKAPSGSGNKPSPNYRFIVRGLFIQTMISLALFIILFVMFRMDNPMAKQGQQVVTAALTEQINFDSAANWYKQVFSGAPSFIPMFGSDKEKESKLAEGVMELSIVAPLSKGAVVRSFAETLSGVEIAGESQEAVLAAEVGRVLLVTDDERTGKTIVIQHADNRVTVYGRLGQVATAVNDWVEAGQTLGKLPAADAAEGGKSLLFFAVKEKGAYVNPADVVPLD
ncbi:hypothetical protein Back11_06020 [Paenibacillus baekrokdamisoli]|uniref:M23ase beta-sheet core domain-containing protein n=1 Tax=Paenibacillus baekrokdamisoli TaxID=1712516 RepID=A0A3G9IJS7_9BACL|nr:M23 family metallopeptidase [Paenibacillus baekrokdamisoli]MBB3067558.1 stage IV sporulation protein FA [Paenibacillus baekrokdamisoli]BBH19257.1 hypothetical protein Back11_06020 [Paenibacillus baekrokdamisoli]